MAPSSLWPRFQKYFLSYDELGFSIDISRMRFGDEFFNEMRERVEKAYVQMRELAGDEGTKETGFGGRFFLA